MSGGLWTGSDVAEWPVFVINLSSATSRWHTASRQLEQHGIGFERISGVDGPRLSPAEIARVYDAKRNRRIAKAPMAPEEIGCYLSHIRAWQRIGELGLTGAFVLEDDFVAATKLPDVLRSIPALPENWDIIKLHCGSAVHGWKLQPLVPGHDLFELAKVPIRTLGYAVTGRAAALLVEKSVPFARPIDIDHKHWWEAGLKIKGVYPPVLEVDPRYLSTSTIGQARRRWREQATFVERVARGLRHVRDETRYQIGLRRHRLMRVSPQADAGMDVAEPTSK